MKHIKLYPIFEEVSITAAKKTELMPLIKKDLQFSANKWFSPEHNWDLKELVKVAKDKAEIDLKTVLDGLNAKIVNSAIPAITFASVTTGTEPIAALNLITVALDETLRSLLGNVSWGKRKLIGAAMRIKHPTKASFLQNLKDPNLSNPKFAREAGYTFHFYLYRSAIRSLLTSGAAPFISKPDYFISSNKADRSRQNYDKFYQLIQSEEFNKKIEASFDKLLNTVWDAI